MILTVPCCLENLTLCKLFDPIAEVFSLFWNPETPQAFDLLQLPHYFTFGQINCSRVFTVQEDLLLLLISFKKSLFTPVFIIEKHDLSSCLADVNRYVFLDRMFFKFQRNVQLHLALPPNNALFDRRFGGSTCIVGVLFLLVPFYCFSSDSVKTEAKVES